MMYNYEIRRAAGYSPAAFGARTGEPPRPNGDIEIVQGADFDFLYSGEAGGHYPTGIFIKDEEGARVWAMFQLPQSIKRIGPVIQSEEADSA